VNVLTSNAVVAVTIGVLFACGLYLMMSRNLIRVLLGFLLVGHGTNLLLLSSGRAGSAPIVGEPGDGADPLPQALILTSIVISLAVATFLMAMAYRNYQLTTAADLTEDPEDLQALRSAAEAD
jgi:multicomponent Na+:H+ antiporter subunit C